MKRMLSLLIGLLAFSLVFLPATNVFADLAYELEDVYDPTEALTGIRPLSRPSIFLFVNGGRNSRITSGQNLSFVANVYNDERLSAPDRVTWSWEIEGVSHTEVSYVTGRAANMTLNYSDLSGALANKNYLMTATYTENNIVVSDTVRFGVSGESTVYFVEPGIRTTVSIDDPVHFKVEGRSGNEFVLEWNCGSSFSAGYSCPSRGSHEVNLAFSRVGFHTISVRLSDNSGNTFEDEITINVVDDLPKIFILSDNEYAPGGVANMKVSASDKFGTVSKLEWGCGNNAVAADFTSERLFDPARKNILNSEVSITLPNIETDNYVCKYRATDDDGGQAVGTVSFAVRNQATSSSTDDISEPEDVSSNITSPSTGIVSKNGDVSATEDDVTIIAACSIIVCGFLVFVVKRCFASNKQ